MSHPVKVTANITGARLADYDYLRQQLRLPPDADPQLIINFALREARARVKKRETLRELGASIDSYLANPTTKP